MLSVGMRLDNGTFVYFQVEEYSTPEEFYEVLDRVWQNRNGILPLPKPDGTLTLVNLRHVATTDIKKVDM